MTLTGNDISTIVGEIAPQVVGAMVTDVVETSLWALVLHLERPGQDRPLRLLLSANNDFSRLHLVTAPLRLPKPALPMGNLASRHLAGHYLQDLIQKPGDRVLRLGFSNHMVLVAELTGRHANIFLADPQGLILGMLRGNRSKVRELYPGKPYVESPAHDAGGPASALEGPVSSRLVEERYRRIEDQEETARLFRLLSRELGRKEKALDKALAKAREDEDKARDMVALRGPADLLAAHFHLLKRGMDQVTVTDFHTGQPLVIPLDPAQSPRENLERMYQRARKGDRGMLMARQRGEALVEQQQRLLGQRQELTEMIQMQEPGREQLHALARDLGLVQAVDAHARRGEKPLLPAVSKKQAEKRALYREFFSQSGKAIWVGVSAEANDRMTFGLLKKNDFWFHITPDAGAHVAVPMGRDETPPDPETMRDAALLAAYYSGKRPGAQAEVMYCRRKDVKPTGRRSKPGSVQVSHPRYLTVTVDKDRIRRLMDSRKDGTDA